MDCTVQQVLTDESPTFALPGAFFATIDRGRATWISDPGLPWEGTQILMSGIGVDGGGTVSFLASTSWLAAIGRGDSFSLIDVKRMPGWNPALAGFATGASVTYDVLRFRGRYDGDYAGCRASGGTTW